MEAFGEITNTTPIGNRTRKNVKVQQIQRPTFEDENEEENENENNFSSAKKKKIVQSEQKVEPEVRVTRLNSIDSVKKSGKKILSEVDILRGILQDTQAHWTRLRDALHNLTNMIRDDRIEGEELIKLAGPLGTHVKSTLSQIALAACSCVEDTSHLSSKSKLISEEQFAVYCYEIIGHLCFLTTSLSAGCKTAQDVGVRCIRNLYLQCPTLDMDLVLGPGSIGLSKNVLGRRSICNLVFALAFSTEPCTPERDEAIADAIAKYFVDTDPETRSTARRALAAMASRRSTEWVERKILENILSIDMDEVHVRQFSLEFPDVAKRLGLETIQRGGPIVSSVPRPVSRVEDEQRRESFKQWKSEKQEQKQLESKAFYNLVTSPLPISNRILQEESFVTATFHSPADEQIMGSYHVEADGSLDENEEEIVVPQTPPLQAIRNDLSSSPFGDMLIRAKIARQHSAKLEDTEEGETKISRALIDRILTPESSPLGQSLLDMKTRNNLRMKLMTPISSFPSPTVKELKPVTPIAMPVHAEVKEIRMQDVNTPAISFGLILIIFVLSINYFTSTDQAWYLENLNSTVGQDKQFEKHYRSFSHDSVSFQSDEQVTTSELPESFKMEEELAEIQPATLIFSQELAENPSQDDDEEKLKLDVSDLVIHEELPQEIHVVDKAIDASTVDDVNIVDNVELEEQETIEEKGQSKTEHGIEVDQLFTPLSPQIDETASIKHEHSRNEEPEKVVTEHDSWLGIFFILSILGIVAFAPRTSGNEEDGHDEMNNVTSSEMEIPKRKKKLSPPKGRFAAVEVAESNEGGPTIRPVMRSRRVTDPENVSVQDVEGRGAVTVITTPRRSTRRNKD